ncbi:MAG TPA: substrate-binding domain-containing protein, partial [Lacipirellula sp.]
RVVVLVDDARAGVGAERLHGMIQGISFANRFGKRWEVVERLEDHDSADDRAENLRSALQSNRDVDLVVDLGDRQGKGGVAPLAELAARHDARLITFDGSNEALAGVESGEVYAVIGENRFLQGSESVKFLARVIHEKPMGLPLPGRGGVNVPAQVLRRDNLAGYRTPEFVSLTPAA